ncbi:MAG: hypothetical protein L0Z50_24150 [Verrucomicrobiales bacterium]|nr:hypothetical protein [Verrucomicrobiales bacterium]
MNSLDRMAGWLRRQKDSASSFLVERALQRALWDYGRMLDLKLDSRQKSVQCDLLLKGETQPVTIVVQQYDLVTDASGTFIVIRQATASREWLTAVLENFVCGKKFPVPEKYANLLRIIA